VGGFEDSDILETANFNVVCNYWSYVFLL
jgi:hypothetical protein